MMALLMGARAPHLLARACDLGVAMQLTNIARDVGEDARAGRLYLPLAWLREAGIDPDAWLTRPAFTPALGDVVRRLLQQADVLYARAGAGIAAFRSPAGPAFAPPVCSTPRSAARSSGADSTPSPGARSSPGNASCSSWRARSQ